MNFRSTIISRQSGRVGLGPYRRWCRKGAHGRPGGRDVSFCLWVVVRCMAAACARNRVKASVTKSSSRHNHLQRLACTRPSRSARDYTRTGERANNVQSSQRPTVMRGRGHERSGLFSFIFSGIHLTSLDALALSSRCDTATPVPMGNIDD